MLARPEAEPDLYPYNLENFPRDAIYHYDKQVVVLFDNRAFSAAELILAGLAELQGVTLIGTRTTAGGGGSPAEFLLTNTGLEFQVCNRVFLRRDGHLIDGCGVRPDICIEPEPEYFLGQEDRMLKRAVKFLSEAR